MVDTNYVYHIINVRMQPYFFTALPCRTVVGTEISVTLLSINKCIQKQYIFKSVLQRNRYGL